MLYLVRRYAAASPVGTIAEAMDVVDGLKSRLDKEGMQPSRYHIRARGSAPRYTVYREHVVQAEDDQEVTALAQAVLTYEESSRASGRAVEFFVAFEWPDYERPDTPKVVEAKKIANDIADSLLAGNHAQPSAEFYRFVICVDVSVPDRQLADHFCVADAYGVMYDALGKVEEATQWQVQWESSDEAYHPDGDRISNDHLNQSRMEAIEARPQAPPPRVRSLGTLCAGSKIVFIKQLDGPADEYGPARVYAEKGEKGEVIGSGSQEGYWVKTDHWPAAFGAVLGEEFHVLPVDED